MRKECVHKNHWLHYESKASLRFRDRCTGYGWHFPVHHLGQPWSTDQYFYWFLLINTSTNFYWPKLQLVSTDQYFNWFLLINISPCTTSSSRSPDLLINFPDARWCGDGAHQLAGKSINWIQFRGEKLIGFVSRAVQPEIGGFSRWWQEDKNTGW